jgi:CDP-diacylglycerol--serine O-phosphatidyltransferase
MKEDDDHAKGAPVLTVLRRRPRHPRRFRRGVYLLPSLFTLGNMFCGWCCVVYTMRGSYAQAAVFIGFDSLADVISFGIAPAILSFAWGLQPFGRLGWAAGFLFVSAAAIRLARFNIQTGQNQDKRYFVGMPSPSAAGVLASTVFAYPYGLQDWHAALALPVVLVPAFLMVSTIRYRSFKTFDLGTRRSYRNLILIATVMAAIATHPQVTLAVMAYLYLLSGLIGAAWGRLYRRGDSGVPAALPEASSRNEDLNRQEPPQGAAHSG